MSDNRVEIKFEHRFSKKSDNGKAFKWLKDRLGSATDDAIANAIRLLYLPAALAEAGASRQEVEAEAKKARDFVNEKMMAALGSCYEKEDSSIKSNGYSPVPSLSDGRSGVMLALEENISTSNSANVPSKAVTEPDDDGFLELDEDKLMEY